jgi:hypothetical protein
MFVLAALVIVLVALAVQKSATAPAVADPLVGRTSTSKTMLDRGEMLASIPFDDDHATIEAAHRALPSDSP